MCLHTGFAESRRDVEEMTLDRLNNELQKNKLPNKLQNSHYGEKYREKNTMAQVS